MTQKFVCLRCGNCCTRFGIDADKKADTGFAGDGFRIIFSNGLTLFDFEKGLFPSCTIGEAYLDLKNDTTIVINYRLDTEPCPMLTKHNVCKIYITRPVTCREFPCPYSGPEELAELRCAHGHCTAELGTEEMHEELGIRMADGKAVFNPNMVRKKLYERYGDSFLYSWWKSIVYERMRVFIQGLEKRHEIKLARKGYPIDFLMKRIKNSKKVDVSELYLRYTGQKLYDTDKIPEEIEKLRNAVSP